MRKEQQPFCLDDIPTRKLLRIYREFPDEPTGDAARYFFDHKKIKSGLQKALRIRLGNVPPSQRKVLETYYLDGENPTWEEVAEKLNYSVSRIYQLRRAALETLDAVYKRHDQ